MRTLRIGKIELHPARERAGDHDLDDDDREARGPRPRLAKGTPWTTPVPRPLPEEEAHDDPTPAADEPDDALILASPLAQLDPDDDDDGPLPPVDVEVELGACSPKGCGVRAARSIARSGWVEARPAGEAPRATSDAPSTQAAMRAVIAAAVAEASSRRAIAYGSSDVKHAPPVQPQPADRPLDPAAASSELAVSPAPRGKGWRTSAGSRTSAGRRALGVLLLAAATAALAAFLATAVS
ncbi:MAG TPA: hypothetical protein VK932_11745 [Kofleriaceae bacterium]|nr:hypothetical protein [Kofleriaceae bacterium]